MSRSILIVDDSVTMRRMVGTALADAGFHVLDRSNREEAIQTLAAHPACSVDLIITDLNMPVMDGIAFVRQVRALSAYRYTPILVLTTEDRAAFRDQGKAAGATGWIVKPFDPDQLLRVIRKVLPS